MANESTQACNSKPTENQCNCKLTYTLIQQTPLIHFQPNQQGATLRATEVKPKLDRWLLSHCTINDQWKISKDKNALNYKMRINASGQKSSEINKYKAFFGKDKQTVFYNEITLSIICFHTDLLKIIDESIEAFFALTNFGTRQTKGFGGFLIKKEPENIESTDQIIQKRELPYLKYFDSCKTQEDALNHALAVYNLMKSGYNLRSDKNGTKSKKDFYIKGFIRGKFLYDNYDDKDNYNHYRSDKAFIKANVFEPNDSLMDPDEKESSGQTKYVFSRAMLGLAGNISFRDRVRNGTVKIKNKDIKRFASPLLIKVFHEESKGYHVYMIFTDSYKTIMNKWFSFSLNNKDSKKISTPIVFDPHTFLANFIQFFDNDFIPYCETYCKNNKITDKSNLEKNFPNKKTLEDILYLTGIKLEGVNCDEQSNGK